MSQTVADNKQVQLEPLALEKAPALIESVFPAQKVSFEAQKERKANLGQTLTGLGSYWKGRKPLILVRAIVLGSLLPRSDDPEADLQIFERLMAFDKEGLARRAMIQNKLRPADIAARITLDNPWDYFAHNIKPDDDGRKAIESLSFPVDTDDLGLKLRWQRGLKEHDKLALYRKALSTFSSYEEKAALCKRPEEVDQEWLYEPVWPIVNEHYAHLGVKAYSFPELIEQLGILRYGKRPRVGDSFCGGGSIPFEATRLGCDVYASDLNPVACMLTWGALNIIGAPSERRMEIERAQEEVAEAVDQEITSLGIEHDDHGNRAKAYLYCLETRCPETGWMVPLLPSRVISQDHNVIAILEPNHDEKRFDIRIVTGASKAAIGSAATGTVREGALDYELYGRNYHTPLKTLRGDYRKADGESDNRLRRWERRDFKPQPDDLFQERLYAIQWIKKETQGNSRPETFFAGVTTEDLEREKRIESIVSENLLRWQEKGLVPDMAIEPGSETTRLRRERGWTYWHHLFSPRQLLNLSLLQREVTNSPLRSELTLAFSKCLDRYAKLCQWSSTHAQDIPLRVFVNQALNTLLNWGVRASYSFFGSFLFREFRAPPEDLTYRRASIVSGPANEIKQQCELFVTDPPYADAVNYHEITEFFIAWLRKNPPPPFDEWTWDSRRALAIQGSGDDFRRGMVDAYKAMAGHMPENGIQCVMFTHQDTGVWSDMVGIFWAAGLQVVAAWYIATETTSELKKGGYVQGTVILMLRKRASGDRPGFRQRILPAVRAEVERQIESMMHLNEEVRDKYGEPVFNDSDLQMAGYAAALKVLTGFTTIGGENVTSFALRPRRKGETTVVDEIVQQASEAANSLLVPDGLDSQTWSRVNGIQRFYLRMMDMETAGASKLDNYQNFAKAFRVSDYAKVMGSMTANKAHLKPITKFTSRDLTESTELGATPLGRLIVGIQQILKETEPQVVVGQLQEELADFLEIRPVLIAMLEFIELKSPEEEVRNAAEVLAGRLKNLRAIGQ